MFKYNPNSKGVRIALNALLIFSVIFVLIYLAFAVHSIGTFFRETTNGGNPIYFFGLIILICLFLGNRGALFEILASWYCKIKDKIFKKEEL